MNRSQEMYPIDLSQMEDWVRSQAAVGSRVLEIGCGDATLVRRLADEYVVIGVDPHANPSPNVHAMPFEELDAEPFDVVFASVSLHHLVSLDAAVVALKRLTRPGTMMLVREFDWLLNDHEPTLRWWYEHRRDQDPHEHSGERPLAATFEEFVPDWRGWMTHHVSPWSSVVAMLGNAGFETISDVPSPYLFRWGLGDEFRAEEEQLAAEGVINLIGHHWTGRRT